MKRRRDLQCWHMFSERCSSGSILKRQMQHWTRTGQQIVPERTVQEKLLTFCHAISIQNAKI
eukprot:393566-Hanusia_phi.AAC.1